MSYILDALNKADNERERQRSAVPGLQSYADAERTGGAGGAWRWVALGALVVLAAVLAWQWWTRSEPAPPVAATAPTPMAQALPQSMPQPVPPPAATLTSPTPAPGAVVPAAPPMPALAAPPAPVASQAAAVKPQQAPAAAAKPAVPAASAPARLPTRNELPPELRAALPPISISGAVYAPAPKDRLLFANGAVLKEGDALAEGLVVERIGASSSVLVFRGQRFELKH